MLYTEGKAITADHVMVVALHPHSHSWEKEVLKLEDTQNRQKPFWLPTSSRVKRFCSLKQENYQIQSKSVTYIQNYQTFPVL